MLARLCRIEDRSLVGASRPIEVDVLTSLDLADSRVAADRAPDLSLELTLSNVIAVEHVVYEDTVSLALAPQHHDTHSNRSGQGNRRCRGSDQQHSQPTKSCATPSA
jgi:hypothetical protein